VSGGWGTPSGQGLNQLSDLDAGAVFVQGKDQETARRLLAAADQVGVERVLIRTTMHGFVVPEAVWDAAEDNRRADQGLDI
jgi:hypothetical protein